MYLSKSDYKKFLKHPAWLWLKKHQDHKIPDHDENTQAIFDAGKRFEKHANKRFKPGVEIESNSYEEYKTMPERTKRAIKKGVDTIFQGRLEAGKLTCIADVLDRVEENTFDLHEIKSSTKVKTMHEHGLAFQTIVFESAGLNIRNISVVHVNRDYVREGEIDHEAFSVQKDVTDKVRAKIEETKENIKEAVEVINSNEMPDPSPRHKKRGSLNDWMEIYENLEEVHPYSIYNLSTRGLQKRLDKLEEKNIELIENIPSDFDLTDKQKLQVQATKQDERIIKEDKIKEFLDSFEYPLYFLDYETAGGTIPPFEKTSPYQSVPFQYSLHTLKSPDAELKHSEYLHTEDTLPAPELLDQLEEDIGDKGSVIVWWESFEKGCNENMAKFCPEYSEFLEDINNRIVDLMEPFANDWFVDKDFHGSASIKKVLPVLVPELDYSELDIQEGQSAKRLWMDAVLRDKEIDMSKEELFDELLEYCKLDTLAMVEIWKKLREEVN